MRFQDELRESVGERCIVTDLRTGTNHPGAIVEAVDRSGKVVVQYDSGPRVRVGFGFVTLTEPETP